MEDSTRDWDVLASRLGSRAAADGAPTRWFEELWSAAARDEVDLPWDRRCAYPPVADHVAALGDAAGRRAVVVGAGLGADAELLAAHGWRTTAFDIAPSAVDAVRGRYPGSPVAYRVADLLSLPDDLVGAFDLVVEVFTVQALPPSLRSPASAAVRSLLAPGGELLAVQLVREDGDDSSQGPPWPLDRAEMEGLAGEDVRLVTLGRRAHPARPDGPPLWVAVLRRDGGPAPTLPA
jgi:SAM-dependent methyltransferase